MIDQQDHTTYQALREFFHTHKPVIGLLLVGLSFLVSIFIALDVWSLYTKVVSTQPRPTNIYSLLFQYTSHRGVYFARFYLMISLYVLIILSFTAGYNFLQEVDTPHLLYRFTVSAFLVIVYVLVNAYLTFIITLLTNQLSSLNVRDYLIFLAVFYLLTILYYFVFKEPGKSFHRNVLIIGLILIPVCIFIEFLGFLLIITAPHA